MRFIICLVLTCFCMAPAYGQITITDEDFLGLGDSYTALLNPSGSPVDVTGLILEPGEQAWDFTSFGELELRTAMFDYVETTTGEFGGELIFPTANLALQISEDPLETGVPTILGYTYLSQDITGRRTHGVYIPDLVDQPELVNIPPVLNAPFPLTFGQTWTSDSIFERAFNVMDTLIDTRSVIHTESVADGFGTITLPGLGTLNCLRVQEFTTTEVTADFFGLSIPLDTLSTRAYVWYAEGVGEVARITSEFFGSVVPPNGVPPVDFTTALEVQIQIANVRALEVPILPTQ